MEVRPLTEAGPQAHLPQRVFFTACQTNLPKASTAQPLNLCLFISSVQLFA